MFLSFQFQIANDTTLKSPSFALQKTVPGTLCENLGQFLEFSILDIWPKHLKSAGSLAEVMLSKFVYKLKLYQVLYPSSYEYVPLLYEPALEEPNFVIPATSA
jgi:hypothetical protein